MIKLVKELFVVFHVEHVQNKVWIEDFGCFPHVFGIFLVFFMFFVVFVPFIVRVKLLILVLIGEFL